MAKLPTLAEARAEVDAAKADVPAASAAYHAAVDALQAANARLRKAERDLTAAREREAANQIARDRREAQTLAKRYGISIERDHIEGNYYHYWVLGPRAVYGGGYDAEAAAEEGVRADPCAGDHIGTCWSEVLANVKAYVADIEAMGAERAQALLADA